MVMLNWRTEKIVGIPATPVTWNAGKAEKKEKKAESCLHLLLIRSLFNFKFPNPPVYS